MSNTVAASFARLAAQNAQKAIDTIHAHMDATNIPNYRMTPELIELGHVVGTMNRLAEQFADQPFPTE